MTRFQPRYTIGGLMVVIAVLAIGLAFPVVQAIALAVLMAAAWTAGAIAGLYVAGRLLFPVLWLFSEWIPRWLREVSRSLSGRESAPTQRDDPPRS